jgi:hypothetical protein
VQCYDAAEEAMATTTRRVATEEDLLAMPPDGHKYELVDGEIRMSPAGDRREAGTNAAARVRDDAFSFRNEKLDLIRSVAGDDEGVDRDGGSGEA